MIFAELERQLIEHAIPVDAYALGTDRDESWCVVEAHGVFAVYYSERGRRVGERTFTDAGQAGRYLRSLLEPPAGGGDWRTADHGGW